MSKNKTVSAGLFKLSILLYLVSLTLNGYYVSGPNPEAWAPTFALVLVGWLGLFVGVTAWLANPALWMAWIVFRKKKYGGALIISAMALVLSLSFLGRDTIIVSEAPTYETIIGYGLGYWLWIAASIMLIGASSTALFQRPKQEVA